MLRDDGLPVEMNVEQDGLCACDLGAVLGENGGPLRGIAHLPHCETALPERRFEKGGISLDVARLARDIVDRQQFEELREVPLRELGDLGLQFAGCYRPAKQKRKADRNEQRSHGYWLSMWEAGMPAAAEFEASALRAVA